MDLDLSKFVRKDYAPAVTVAVALILLASLFWRVAGADAADAHIAAVADTRVAPVKQQLKGDARWRNWQTQEMIHIEDDLEDEREAHGRPRHERPPPPVIEDAP